MDMAFFDWSYLGTFAGALAAVALITQLIKDLPGVNKVPTQAVSWILAVVVLLLANWFGGTLDAQNGVLCLLNGAMVSLAANGGYAALKRVMNGAKDENKPPEDE